LGARSYFCVKTEIGTTEATARKKEENMPKEGFKALAFCLPSVEKDQVCLKDFSGKWVVLYFYPKDSTSG
jgi:alkyl hydroperoxide reductase subunit AhpC